MPFWSVKLTRWSARAHPIVRMKLLFMAPLKTIIGIISSTSKVIRMKGRNAKQYEFLFLLKVSKMRDRQTNRHAEKQRIHKLVRPIEDFIPLSLNFPLLPTSFLSYCVQPQNHVFKSEPLLPHVKVFFEEIDFLSISLKYKNREGKVGQCKNYMH